VAEYPDGFLLAEVPLGEGFVDLPRIARMLRRARPDIHLNLEMITRDPLRIPCLTDYYWATLEKVPARELAATYGTPLFTIDLDVLDLEIDETFGQTGNIAAAGSCGGTASTVNAGLGAGTVCSSPQRFGTTAGWALNTDTQGVIDRIADHPMKRIG